MGNRRRLGVQDGEEMCRRVSKERKVRECKKGLGTRGGEAIGVVGGMGRGEGEN